MKAVIQRVARASVEVGGQEAAAIARGLLALVGIEAGDTDADAAWLAEKLATLRIFDDPAGKMNLSLQDVGGSLLLVPNFTLAGDARKGRRPSFDRAMRPEQAEPLFRRLAEAAAAHGIPIATGVFRAYMLVTLVNDGPVTLLLESRADPRP